MIKNIVLLKGGFSDEAEISRNTAKSVETALKSIGYNVTSIEVNNDFPNWIIKNKKKIDLVFNALHGNWGEDGKIQGFLEYIGIPYTHSGVTASAIGMNKFLAKKIFISEGLKLPKSKILDLYDIEKKDPYKRPFVIKPISGGSSLGIKIVEKETSIKEIICKTKDYKIMVEEFIPGRDVTVALLDGKILGMLEVEAKSNFYNYSAKYDKNSQTKYFFPDDISEEIRMRLFDSSIKANNILNCQGVTRVDFRLNLNLGLEGVYLLEINTQPGLTKNSLVPKIAKNAGLSFDDLIKFIVSKAGVNK